MSRVSVVIPTYNRCAYVQEAIDSVLAQTYTDYEIIVIDDGSTDGTGKALRERYGDRIRYQWQENQERSAARNAGIACAQGEYLAFLDADDYWLPSYLKRQVHMLDADSDAGMSRTFAYAVDAECRAVRVGGNGAADAGTHKDFLSFLLVANRMVSCAVVARTECVRAVGGFDVRLRQSEDWDLWLQMALRWPVLTVAEPLTCYRLYNSHVPSRWGERDLEHSHPQIIEKAFALVAEYHPALSSLKPRALAQAFLDAAWIRYALGDAARGQYYVELARGQRPELFEEPATELLAQLAYKATDLYDIVTPLPKAFGALDSMFDNLPPWCQSLRVHRDSVKGSCAGITVFRDYQSRHFRSAAGATWPALRYRPRWLSNRGFLATAGRSAWAAAAELHRRGPDARCGERMAPR